LSVPALEWEVLQFWARRIRPAEHRCARGICNVLDLQYEAQTYCLIEIHLVSGTGVFPLPGSLGHPLGGYTESLNLSVSGGLEPSSSTASPICDSEVSCNYEIRSLSAT